MFSLHLCPVHNIPHIGDVSRVMGMTWRFLPLADPSVDIMVSRDLDSRCFLPDKLPANNKLFISRFTSREEAAVAEWLSSSLPFHTMRDHPDHQVEIMGGMWGARMDLGHRELFSNLTKLFIDDVSTPPPPR